MNGVVWQDFLPWGDFTQSGYQKDMETCKDCATNKVYNYPTFCTIWMKCSAAFLGGNILQVGMLTINIFHIIEKKDKTCLDLIRIVITPFILLGFIFVSLYGALGRPRHASRMYAALENVIYGGPVLAPCFQPFKADVRSGHLFGGNPRYANVW